VCNIPNVIKAETPTKRWHGALAICYMRDDDDDGDDDDEE
jgi:hypothetical protein